MTHSNQCCAPVMAVGGGRACRKDVIASTSDLLHRIICAVLSAACASSRRAGLTTLCDSGEIHLIQSSRPESAHIIVHLRYAKYLRASYSDLPSWRTDSDRGSAMESLGAGRCYRPSRSPSRQAAFMGSPPDPRAADGPTLQSSRHRTARGAGSWPPLRWQPGPHTHRPFIRPRYVAHAAILCSWPLSSHLP